MAFLTCDKKCSRWRLARPRRSETYIKLCWWHVITLRTFTTLNQILIKLCQCSTARSTSISTTEVCVGNSRFIGVAVEEASSVEQPYSRSNPLLVYISSVPWLMRRARSIHVSVAWNCTIVTRLALFYQNSKRKWPFSFVSLRVLHVLVACHTRDTPTLGHGESNCARMRDGKVTCTARWEGMGVLFHHPGL